MNRTQKRLSNVLLGLICLTIFVSGAPRARAVLQVYEGFDYTPGSELEGLSGGFGWDLAPEDPNFGAFPGGWDSVQGPIDNDVIQADSLTYMDGQGNQLVTTGGTLLNTGSGGTSSQGGRTLTQRRSTGTTWLSFLSERIGELSTDNTYNRGANLATFDMFRGDRLERLNIGPENSGNSWLNPDTMAPEDRFQLRYPDVQNTILNTNLPEESQPPTENNNTAAGAADRYRDVFTEVGTHQTNLFVMRIDHIEGDNDNIYFWMNPELGSTPLDSEVSGRYLAAHIQAAADAADPPVAQPYGATGDGEQSFDRIRFFAGNASATQPFAELLIDEIRIGDTFADVTPFIPAAGGLDGDYNDDGRVDAGDYVRWRNALAGNGTIENESVSLGTVDIEDYDEWKANYGNPGSGSGGLGVPEPAAALLALVAAAGVIGLRRRTT